jgi:predicted nucleic-acid-binding protein
VIGLDTNVLVRYTVQDDAGQSAAATSIVESLSEESPGFVSVVVIVELTWVLRRAYRSPDSVIAAVVRTLLDATEIVVQDSDAVRRALDRTAGGQEFPVALIAELGFLAGCFHTVTFDRAAAKLPYLQLIDS